MTLRGLIGACMLVACSQPAPAPQPPANRVVAPTPAPTNACNRDFSWFERIRYLRYTEFSHGHFGEWRFHVDLYRLDGEAEFHGVAMGSYREHERKPIVSDTSAVAVKTLDAVKLLTRLRDGVTTPPDNNDRGRVVVSDSSRSVVISIEAMAFDPRTGRHPNFHVEFFTDDGETQPQLWNIRGCTYDPSLAARRALEKTTVEFATSLGNAAMLQRLSSKP